MILDGGESISVLCFANGSCCMYLLVSGKGLIFGSGGGQWIIVVFYSGNC